MSETESERGGARVRIPPPLVFVAFMAVGVLVNWLMVPLRLPLPLLPRVIAGALLIVAGLALGIWSVVHFRRTGQDPAPWEPSPTLILEGPYRFTRNPIYVGMTVVQLGVGVCAANGWILALAPLALLLVHFTAVLPEEAYLAARFGEDYRRYQAAVRRYL
jgi:protein-S-isoprenylcysteine O-methyltransferase Ste14